MFAILADLATVKLATPLVNVQLTALPGAVEAESSESTPVKRFGVAVPAPNPVQLAAVKPYPIGMVSVIVVAVDDAASVRVAPATLAPCAIVVMVCEAPKPLVPLNVNAPVPPFEILFSVMVAGVSSLLIVQVAD